MSQKFIKPLLATLLFFFLQQVVYAQICTQTDTLTPSAPASDFGQDVKLSPDGQIAVVGAPADPSTTVYFTATGSVTIFENQAGAWVETQKIIDPLQSHISSGGFGNHVAIGEKVIAASSYESAYILEEVSGNWVVTFAIHNLGSGIAVEVTADGQTVFITDPGFAGDVLVFEKVLGSWSQTALLQGSDSVGADNFGVTIASSPDSQTVAIGARGHDVNRGAIYVFEKTGTTWSEVAKLMASDAKSHQQLGQTIDMSDSSIVAGVTNHDVLASNAGAAYIFEKIAGVWREQETVIFQASDAGANDSFGRTVAISGDVVVIGNASFTPGKDGAYIFVKDPGSGQWGEVEKIGSPVFDFDSLDISGKVILSGISDTQEVTAYTCSFYTPLAKITKVAGTTSLIVVDLDGAPEDLDFQTLQVTVNGVDATGALLSLIGSGLATIVQIDPNTLVVDIPYDTTGLVITFSICDQAANCGQDIN